MHVVRNAEAFSDGAVGKRDRVIGATLVRFDEHEQFPEDPGQIAPVDLVDDEDERRLRLLFRALAKLEEHPITQREAARLRRPPTLHEVLVRIGLVELHHLDGTRILVPDQAPRDSLGDERLAYPRRPLEDQILAQGEGVENALELCFFDEEILERTTDTIRFRWNHHRPIAIYQAEDIPQPLLVRSESGQCLGGNQVVEADRRVARMPLNCPQVRISRPLGVMYVLSGDLSPAEDDRAALLRDEDVTDLDFMSEFPRSERVVAWIWPAAVFDQCTVDGILGLVLAKVREFTVSDGRDTLFLEVWPKACTLARPDSPHIGRAETFSVPSLVV